MSRPPTHYQPQSSRQQSVQRKANPLPGSNVISPDTSASKVTADRTGHPNARTKKVMTDPVSSSEASTSAVIAFRVRSSVASTSTISSDPLGSPEASTSKASEEQPKLCPTCLEIFFTERSLELHLKTHTGKGRNVIEFSESTTDMSRSPTHDQPRSSRQQSVQRKANPRPRSSVISPDTSASKVTADRTGHPKARTKKITTDPVSSSEASTSAVIEYPVSGSVASMSTIPSDPLGSPEASTSKATVEQPKLCPICLEIFFTERSLEVHLKTHTGKGRNVIDFLESTTDLSRSLTHHQPRRSRQQSDQRKANPLPGWNVISPDTSASKATADRTGRPKARKKKVTADPVICSEASISAVIDNPVSGSLASTSTISSDPHSSQEASTSKATKEQPKLCPTCLEIFFTERSLEVHLKTHTGEGRNVIHFSESTTDLSRSLTHHQPRRSRQQSVQRKANPLPGWNVISPDTSASKATAHRTGHRKARTKKVTADPVICSEASISAVIDNPVSGSLASTSTISSDPHSSQEASTSKATKEQPKLCPTCLEIFFTERSLEVHLKTHTGKGRNVIEFLESTTDMSRSPTHHKPRSSRQQSVQRKVNPLPGSSVISPDTSASKATADRTGHPKDRTKEVTTDPVSCSEASTSAVVEYPVSGIVASTSTISSDPHSSQEASTSKATEGQPKLCPTCLEIFFTEPSLEVNLKTNTDKGPNFKGNSKTKISTPSDLKRNTRNQSEVKGFTCTVCKKIFATKQGLKRHTVSHSVVKPYPCTQCNSTFSNLYSLTRHLQNHTADNDFPCTVCNKSFTRKDKLEEHTRTHSDEKLYPCTKCNSKFSNVWRLKRHLHTHQSKKPFLCTKCAKSFATREQLKVHKRTHTGEIPFVCPLCHAAFGEGCNLDRHLRNHR